MMSAIEEIRKSAARAALEPALWPETLWRLGQAMGGDMTVLERRDKTDGTIEIGFTDRPDIVARMRRDYESHYYRTCPRWQLSLRSACYAVLHDDLIGDEAALGRYEYYADFLPDYGLRYFIGTPMVDDAEQTLVLSIQRAPDRGRFTDEERARFDALLPDLRNALALHSRLGRAPGPALAAAWDRISDPVAVVGPEAEVLFANRAMRGLLASGDLVCLEGSRLGVAGGGVLRALRAARRSPSGLGAVRDGPLVFRVVALGAEASGIARTGKGLFCLLIDDPRQPRWQAIHDAMRLYGLTRREAVVGSHAADGFGIDEIALRLGVSRNTVRTHLAMLREKLGVRSTLAAAAEMRRAASPFE